MRLRFAVLASVLTTFALVAVPTVVNAAPHHNHGLTINATPNPIDAGDAVLIYGQLNATPHGGQTVVLYHRVNPADHFTRIGTTTTSPTGFYQFTREEGVVVSNRSWFVRAPGLPGNIHSRTIHELVRADVGLHVLTPQGAATTTSDTNHKLVFAGHVSPNHHGERVLLQVQEGSTGDDWQTIDSARLGEDSNYRIAERFLRPGERDLRVVFPKQDGRNLTGVSDTVTVVIQQAQNPLFTINASAPVIAEGQSVTISGKLISPTATPPSPVGVTLYGHEDGQPYKAIASTTTALDGSYSFALTGGLAPAHNEVYEVRTTFAPKRHTAQLFEGVRDVVTLAVNPTSSTVGGKVAFTGNVMPNKAGHVIYLQRLGRDNDWHTVKVGRVDASSNYEFDWTFGVAGMHTFRVRITGGPENVGAVSAAVTINVTPAHVASLPPGS